jgi:uncharacterized coiled-coil protein SlyX
VVSDNEKDNFEEYVLALYAESNGWIRGHQVPTALHTVRNMARIADTVGTKDVIKQLNDALRKLDLEIERYQQRMSVLRQQAMYLSDLVRRASDVAPEETAKQPERTDGLDEATIERIASAYNPNVRQGWWRD